MTDDLDDNDIYAAERLTDAIERHASRSVAPHLVPTAAELQVAWIRRACTCVALATEHLHCEVCRRARTIDEALRHTVVPSTGVAVLSSHNDPLGSWRRTPLGERDTTRCPSGAEVLVAQPIDDWRVLLVKRRGELSWQIRLREGDRSMRVCRHPCLRAAIAQLAPGDPVRDLLLRELAPADAPGLEQIRELLADAPALALIGAAAGFELSGPRARGAAVFFELTARADVVDEDGTARRTTMTLEFKGRTLDEARASLADYGRVVTAERFASEPIAIVAGIDCTALEAKDGSWALATTRVPLPSATRDA